MTEAQEIARRKKNPVKIIIHYSGFPCGCSSIYGLESSHNKDDVNCITCLRILKNQSQDESLGLSSGLK